MQCRITITLRRALWCTSLVLMSLVPCGRSGAQVRVVGVISDQAMPDSTRQLAAMAASMAMRSPASFALSVKRELGLSPEQVAAVEALVPIEADSMRVRGSRMMESLKAAVQKMPKAAAARTMSWTAPIDEAAVRAAACEQSRTGADMQIGLMRDRQALGMLLTPDQQRQFDRLQSERMSRALQPVNK
jgi:hypothetical protein